MSLATLVVDDDRAFTAVAVAALQREGFPVTVAHSLHEARGAALGQGIELVVLDRRLPDGDGLAFLPELKRLLPRAVVVMVTAHGDIASAVDAIRLGAADYLAKPIELSDLIGKARRAADELRLRARLSHAEDELSGRRRLIRPTSQKMQAVISMLERVAQSPKSAVLLLGETGVGKEVLAWHVHLQGAGDQAPFIHVNCAALPDSTAESELFGHERGAFTDAKTAKRGLVELADNGTLFLDEVGELTAPVQAKLLTFLDSGRFRKLGGQSELSVSARVIAATNRNLQADIEQGRFREDLWFRLGVFKIDVPPLRERAEDIAQLASGMLETIRADLKTPALTLSPRAIERLVRYRFPGNVRELRNILERAAVLEAGPQLDLDWLATSGVPSGSQFTVADLVPLDELEGRYARHVLERLGGKRMEAAKALGVSHPTFLKLLKES
ncbi:MAG: sigma-54-dependent Fis family transcriptional regulator [Archangiaceae bacterium]|nr:sigma-54-dependent Fis family transcriptional regulator [Archangiaceae bacterium]